ncbi:MAG: FtsX-like permease family protein [Thermoproteota archaeon]
MGMNRKYAYTVVFVFVFIGLLTLVLPYPKTLLLKNLFQSHFSYDANANSGTLKLKVVANDKMILENTIFSNPFSYNQNKVDTLLEHNVATITLNLSKRISGFFILNASNNLAVIELNKTSKVSFESERIGRLLILGPFSSSEVLVPFVISFPNLQYLNNEDIVINIPIIYGSKIKLDFFPYIETSNISTSFLSKISYNPSQNFSLILSSYNSSLLSIRFLNTTDVTNLVLLVPELSFMFNYYIVPANTNVSVSVSCLITRETSINPFQRRPFAADFQRSFTQRQILMNFSFQKNFITAPNSTYEISDLANFIKHENMKIINNLTSSINNYMNLLENQGYYLENTREKFSNALKILGVQNSSNFLISVTSQKLSYELLKEVLSSLRSFSTSSVFFIYMFLLTGILSLALARIIAKKPDNGYFVPIALFIILFTMVSQTFPQTKLDLSSLLIVFLFIVILVWLCVALYNLLELENIKTAGGVSLFAAISVMFSFISGFLSKRKLRTFLVLFSIVTITWGLTCLSSVSVSFTTYSQTLGIKSSLGKTYLVLESTSNSISVTPNLLYFLSQINEIQSIAPKLTWTNLISPLDTIAGVPISGVVSVSTNSPLVYQLESAVSPNEALYEVASSQGKIIISDLMAKSSGKQVGDLVFIKGRRYQIAGILNSKVLSKISDVDGQDLLPKVMVAESPASIPPENVIILNDRDVTFSGSFVNKLYLKLEGNVPVSNIANAISMFQNLFVYVAKPNSTMEVYYPSTKFNVVGSELILPIILGFLIIFLTFSSYTYERKREIFTLTTIGANPDHIFLIFLYESAVIGFVGGALGYILGIATFRFLSFTGIIIPVDVKVDIGSSILILFFTIFMSIVGALLPSLRASVSAVPSLRRRWSTEAILVGKEELDRTQQFSIMLPIVIPTNKVTEFVSFLTKKLRESKLPVSISGVSENEESSEYGKVYKIGFNYLQTGNRAFKSQNTLVIRKMNEHYGIELHSKITTIFTAFADLCLRDVASIVRELSLEWSVKSEHKSSLIYSSKKEFNLELRQKVKNLFPVSCKFLLIVLLLLYAYTRLHNLNGRFSYDYDEGVYLQTAKQFINGYQLYSQVFLSQPPLFIYFISFFFLILGENVYAGRVAIAFFSIIGGIITFFISKELVKSKPTAMLSLIVLMLNNVFLYYSRAVEGEVPSVVLSLAAIFFMLKFAKGKELTYIFASGLFLSLAMLTKFFAASTAFSLLLFLFVYSFSSNRRLVFSEKKIRLFVKRITFFIAGGLLPLLILLPYFFNFSSFYSQLFLFHLHKPTGGSVLEKLIQIKSYLSSDLDILLFGIVGFIIAVVTLNVGALLISLWLFSSIVMLVLLPQPLWYHHLVIIVPSLAILSSITFDFVIRAGKSLNSRIQKDRYKNFILFVLPFTLFVLPFILYMPHIPKLIYNDVQIIFYRQNALETEVAKLLDNVTNKTDWVISDDQLTVFVADRNVPPELCDTSFMRIGSGYLTTSELINLSEKYNVKVIIFWTGRLIQLKDFLNYTQRNFKCLKKFGNNQLIYIRKY